MIPFEKEKIKPLTFSDAQKLKEQFSDFTERDFETNDQRGKIISVEIAPFDQINKWIFLQNYLKSRDAGEAMNYYEVPYYDVVMLIKFDNEVIDYKSVREYIIEHNLAHQAQGLL